MVATEPALYFFDAGQLALRPRTEARRTKSQPIPFFATGTSGRDCAIAGATPSCTSSSATGPTCLIIAPLDANTLAKLALGLCDNFLTCLFRAWDFVQAGDPGAGHEYADVEQPADGPPPRATAARSRQRGTACRRAGAWKPPPTTSPATRPT